MTCPVCGGDTFVIDSKKKPDTICRRRQCQDCNHRFTTYEVDQDLYNKLTWSLDKFLERNEVALQRIIHEATDQIRARLHSDYIRDGK